MKQVLTYLIDNACDAYRDLTDVADEDRTIAISAFTEPGHVVLSVKDRAGGIPADAIDRVFEPFFTTKSPDRGSGLGLSVCYHIVRLAGGHLMLRDTLGGASFEITFPVQS